MELLSKIGIDWKLLLAQITNFLILLFILRRFAYKPILKILDDRAKKIEEGLKNAEEAGKKLTEMEQKEKEVLRQARQEAQKIAEKAELQALKNAENIAVAAEKQREKMLQETREQLEMEKKKIIAEAKAEVGALVMQATEKIIDEKLDASKDRELIEKSIK